MGTEEPENLYMWLPVYVNSLPWWRCLLARHFERYKVTRQEYLDWLSKRVIN